jgi:hypothetical protein
MFLQPEIRYLGHVLCAEGIKPVQGKVDAMVKAPKPTNVSELKSLLGGINYYCKFLPNLSTILQPLYSLLHHTAKWLWSKECEQAFLKAKEMLSGDRLLVHFDPKKPLILGVDASPYGLGAVLSHKMSDGTERPIAYASRTLTKAEANYVQIEREGLAIIFGIKKFHMYLYGKRFTLITDHQPLTRIFGPKTGIPPLAAARMQRWALILSGYDYDIIYRNSEDNANADVLSRLPIKPSVPDVEADGNYTFHTAVEDLPLDSRRVAECTRKDPVLVQVLEYTASGWPSHCQDDALQPYWNYRHEFSLDDGCLLWGRRVVIPPALQERMLNELHECHPGMTRMKALARSVVWWPGLDQDIEEIVRACNACVNSQSAPKAVPLMLWPWATNPWQRIHVDFAEEGGETFFIVVDSFSKWLEVVPMKSTTAADTIDVLRTLFASYGLPIEIVSDNGPQFIAKEFKNFLKNNAVKHTLCPPYHPASNGLAERNVQTFKKMFKKSVTSQTLSHRIADVLFHFRNTPHTTTGQTPAMLFLKRAPRTRLSLVKPCLQRRVEDNQSRAKAQHDGSKPKHRTFDVYQKVRVRNTRHGREKWIRGTIVAIKGPLTYLVRIPGNNRRFVHVDHLIPDDSENPDPPREVSTPEMDDEPPKITDQVHVPNIPDLPSDAPQQASTPPLGKTRVPSPRMVNPSPKSSPIPSRVSAPTNLSNTPIKTSWFGREIRKPIRLDI